MGLYVQTPEIPEIATVEVEEIKTLESEVHRLSELHGVNAHLVKKIIVCEAKKYFQEKEGLTHPLTVDGVTYHILLSSTNENKDKLTGEVWSVDHGPMMINDYYHKGSMSAEGYTLSKWEDTVAYGIALLKKEGATPWNASRSCWSQI